MARRRQESEQPFGSDSFLDIVTNVVGILIILVVVVGLRARHTSLAVGAGTGGGVDLTPLVAEHESLTREVLDLSGQAAALQEEASLRYAQREQASLLVAQLERDLAERRQQLGSERQAVFDEQRQLAERQSRLESISRAIDAARQAADTPQRIESYPTPISRQVEGAEAHFRLHGGRVEHIPLDELLEAFKSEAMARMHRLREQEELAGVVGPIKGFRLRYLLERVDVNDGGGRVGSFAQLVKWELVPVDHESGELLADALASGSDFREALTTLNPRKHTVTLWIYPDSFAEYRQLKKLLFEAGYRTAGRPLPEGEMIGGSPQGSRSAAE